MDLFNEDGRYSNYPFDGRFVAKMGVRTKQIEVNPDKDQAVLPVYFPFRLGKVLDGTVRNTMIYIGNVSITGCDTEPYLLVNDIPANIQPDFAVRSIIAFGNEITCIGANYHIDRAYYTLDGSTLTEAQSSFNWDIMQPKAEEWSKRKMGLQYGSSNMYSTAPNGDDSMCIYENGYMQVYEFAPLGHFVAERPMYSSKMQISLECYDLMSELDVDWDTAIKSNVTLGNLFQNICDYADIECAGTDFTNSTVKLKSMPDDFKNATIREVVGWIAQLAGCYCRVDRYGKLKMDWFRQVDPNEFALTKNEFSEHSEAYYDAAPVDKVIIRRNGENDTTSGTGDNAVYIQNNPILTVI